MRPQFSQLLIAAGIVLPAVTEVKPAQRVFYFVNVTGIRRIDNKMNIHTLIFLRFRCDAKFYIRKKRPQCWLSGPVHGMRAASHTRR